MRFFSPPEKPSLTLRLRKAGSIWTTLHFSTATPRNSSGSNSGNPCVARFAFVMRRRKSVFPTPGSSTGYWKARKTPARAASSAPMSNSSTPLSRAEPDVTS